MLPVTFSPCHSRYWSRSPGARDRCSAVHSAGRTEISETEPTAAPVGPWTGCHDENRHSGDERGGLEVGRPGTPSALPLSVQLSVYLPGGLSIHPSICLCVWWSVCPAICLFMCPMVYGPSIHLFICLIVSLSIPPSVYVSNGWSVHPSICLCV